MIAGRYPVRWKLLALIFGGAVVVLYPAFEFAWWVIRGERINPSVAQSLEAIRERVEVGAAREAIEHAIAQQGWTTTQHDQALTKKLLSAQWMDFGPEKSRPVLVPFEASVEATPAGDAVYRSRFPCGYRLRVFFLLDARDRVAQVIEAQHPICL